MNPFLNMMLATLHPSNPPEAITREQRRSRRKREVRARTISVKRMTKRELEIGRMLYPETDYNKPQTRADCAEGLRPCPYVSCKHHLFLDVSARTGAIKLNFPDLEVWDMNESCALDVSDRGGTTLEDVGAIMNLTRERIRQVEVKALLAKLAQDGPSDPSLDFARTKKQRADDEAGFDPRARLVKLWLADPARPASPAPARAAMQSYFATTFRETALTVIEARHK